MMERLLNKNKRIGIKEFRLVAVMFALFTFFLAATNTELHGAFIWAYASPVMYCVVGMSFYNGDYMKKRRYIVFMMYGVWFVICRWLCGNVFMMLSDQLAIAMMAFVLFLALPFACVMEDLDKRRYLDVVCWVAVLMYAACFALIYIGHFRGEQIILKEKYLEFGSEIRHGVLFIKYSNMDDYGTDYVACCCILLCFYLCASNWNKKRILSFVSILIAAFYSITVFLIPCRNVLVGLCGAVLLIIFIFLQKLRIPKKILWGFFALCCIGAAAFVLIGSDQIYTSVANDARSAVARLTSFSGRTTAWSAGFKVLEDEPIGLLRGFPLDEVMSKIMKYDTRGLGHMHNGFMEALMLTGVPGLIMALAFSVKLIISSIRVFFAKPNEIDVSYKLMVVAIAVVFFMNFFDSFLFVCRNNIDVITFFFSIFAGYIFEIEDKLKEKRGTHA